MSYAVKIMTLAALVLSLEVITAAQNQPLAFEVASIRANKSVNEPGSIGVFSGRLAATNVSLKTVLKLIDETNIDGNYDITLGPFLERQDGPRFSGRTIFEAFQDLGLHLEPQKVAVELFVIDHAEKPTEN